MSIFAQTQSRWMIGGAFLFLSNFAVGAPPPVTPSMNAGQLEGAFSSVTTGMGATMGTSVTIPSGSGEMYGPSNLIHSFDTFNLGKNDKAIFTYTGAGSAMSIKNIVARVNDTANGASVIDGEINTQAFSKANFFFINPAGVVIGNTAQINVAQDFCVSTANYVVLSDGSIFYSEPTAGDSKAATDATAGIAVSVAAFGFLKGTTPANIEVDNGAAFNNPGAALQFVGGNFLSTATLSATSIVSVFSGGTVTGSAATAQSTADATVPYLSNRTGGTLTYATPATNPVYGAVMGMGGTQVGTAANFHSLGTVTMTGSATTASGANGHVVIRGGQLVVQKSVTTASTISAAEGADINLTGDVSLTLSGGSTISSTTSSTTPGGSVSILSPTVALQTGTAISSSTTSLAISPVFGGNAGDIAITAMTSLDVAMGAQIFSFTRGTGHAGIVSVSAGTVTITGPVAGTSVSLGATPSETASGFLMLGAVKPTGIFSASSALGAASTISVLATGTLGLSQAGQIGTTGSDIDLGLTPAGTVAALGALSLDSNASIQNGGTTGTIKVAATGAVTLGNTTGTSVGSIASSGGDINLGSITDATTIGSLTVNENSTISTTGGGSIGINVSPTATGIVMDNGMISTPNNISIDSANSVIIGDATLAISLASSGGGNVTLGGTTGIGGLTVNANSSISASNTGTVAITATPTAVLVNNGTIMTAGGDLTIDGGASLTIGTPTFAATIASSGAIKLGTENALGSLVINKTSAIAATGVGSSVRIASAGPVTLNGGTHAGAAITSTGGDIDLTVTTNTGSLTLESNSLIEEKSGGTGLIDIAASGPVTLANSSVGSTAGGSIKSLNGGNVVLGDVSLVTPTTIGTLAIDKAGTISTTAGGAIKINEAATGTVTLVNSGNIATSGDIDIDTAGAVIVGDAITAISLASTGGGDVNLGLASAIGGLSVTTNSTIGASSSGSVAIKGTSGAALVDNGTISTAHGHLAIDGGASLTLGSSTLTGVIISTDGAITLGTHAAIGSLTVSPTSTIATGGAGTIAIRGSTSAVVQNNGTISTVDGSLNIDGTSSITLGDTAHGGTISSADGNITLGGQTKIGALTLNGASSISTASTATAIGSLSIHAGGDIDLSAGSVIETSTAGGVSAGNVLVFSDGDIVVTGDGSSTAFPLFKLSDTGIFSISKAGAGGDAGAIFIGSTTPTGIGATGDINLNSGGQIASLTLPTSTGNAGTVQISNSGNIKVQGFSTLATAPTPMIYSIASGTANAPGTLFIGESTSDGAGNALFPTITLETGASIQTATQDGTAGTVFVLGSNIFLYPHSSIESDVIKPNPDSTPTGSPGEVIVLADGDIYFGGNSSMTPTLGAVNNSYIQVGATYDAANVPIYNPFASFTGFSPLSVYIVGHFFENGSFDAMGNPVTLHTHVPGNGLQAATTSDDPNDYAPDAYIKVNLNGAANPSTQSGSVSFQPAQIFADNFFSQQSAINGLVLDGSLGNAPTLATLTSDQIPAIGQTFTSPAPADITTTTGFTYTILPSYGQTVGDNIFFSFGTFDLGTDGTHFATENAVFNTPGARNILVRVTGGQALIDGPITESAATKANLYFIDPRGIIFGKGGSIVLSAGTVMNSTLPAPSGPAALFLSTADYVGFGTVSSTAPNLPGEEFYADNASLDPQNITLGTANPVLRHGDVYTFGFNDPAAAGNPGLGLTSSITFSGSSIGSNFSNSNPLSIVSGNITIGSSTNSVATLEAVNSQIMLFAPSTPGVLSFRAPVGSPVTSFTPASSLVSLANAAATASQQLFYRVTGGSVNGAGTVSIINGSLLLEKDSPTDLMTDLPGSSILIAADKFSLDNSYVLDQSNATSTDAEHVGGNVIVNANSQVSITSEHGLSSYISTSNFGYGKGDGGDISITTPVINIINSDPSSSSSATVVGIISAAQPNLNFDGGLIGGKLTVNPPAYVGNEDGTAGSISVNLNAPGNLGGSTGTIDSLDVNGGTISAATSGLGDAGPITISGNHATVTVEGGGSISTAVAFTNGAKFVNLGNGNQVSITAASLLVTGTITVTNLMTLGTTTTGSVISTATGDLADIGGAFNTGNGGNIILNVAGALNVLNGGAISASSFTNGQGGTIAIGGGPANTPTSVTINGMGNTSSPTGIYAAEFGAGSSSALPSGNAISLTTSGPLTILDGGQISSSAAGNGSAGNIVISTSALAINGSFTDSNNPPDVLTATPGTTGIFSGTTGTSLGTGFAQATGAGGNIMIAITGAGPGHSLTIEDGGVVSAASLTTGAGGIIAIGGGGTSPSSATIDALTDTTPGTTGVFASESGGGNSAAYNFNQNPVNPNNPPEFAISLTTTGALTIRNGAQISTSTSGTGNAGDITVNAASIAITDAGSVISSATSGLATDLTRIQCAGGNIILNINGGGLTISNGALITASSLAPSGGGISTGTGGAITVGGGADYTPSFVTINGMTATTETGIYASLAGSGNSSDAAAGNNAISLTTSGALILENGGTISTSTTGAGNAGNLAVTVDAVTVTSLGQISSATSGVATNPAQAAGGNITLNINGGALAITDGGQITASSLAPTIGTSTGAGGSIAIGGFGNHSISSVTIDGQSATTQTGIYASLAGTGDSTDAAPGNSAISLATSGALLLENGGAISTSTSRAGNAGNLTVTAGSVTVTSDAQISSATSGVSTDPTRAAGGNITLNVNGGALAITTGGQITASSIKPTAGTSTGAGGSITVGGDANNDNAPSSVTIDGMSAATPTGIFASLAGNGNSSDAGSGNNAISLTTTGALLLENNGTISTSTTGEGNAGNLTATAASVSVTSSGEISSATSGISTDATKATGGNIALNINGGSLGISNGGQINASSLKPGTGTSTGAGGAITIGGVGANTISSITIDGGSTTTPTGIFAALAGTGNSSGLTLPSGNAISLVTTGALVTENGGQISTSTTGAGNAGNITATAAAVTITSAAQISSATSGSSADPGQASGGNIALKINGGALAITSGGEITASSIAPVTGTSTGAGGSIAIGGLGNNSISSVTIDGINATTQTGIYASLAGNGDSTDAAPGNNAISLATSGTLLLQNGAAINTSTRGAGNAGNLTVTASSVTVTSGAQISSATSGVSIDPNKAAGGNIRLNVTNGGTLLLSAGGKITASSLTPASTGAGGAIAIGDNNDETPSSITISGAGTGIFAFLAGSGNSSNAAGGNAISLTTLGALTLVGGGQISSSAAGNGSAGNIAISSASVSLDGAGTGILSGTTGGSLGATFAEQTLANGNGGDINVAITGTVPHNTVSLTGGAAISASSLTQGAGGSITIGGPLSPSGSLNVSGAGSQITSAAGGSGNGGSIDIYVAGDVALTDGGQIIASSLMGGSGLAGEITLTQVASTDLDANAHAGLWIDGASSSILTTANASGSQVATTADPHPGQITLDTEQLTVSNGGVIDSSTGGSYNAGDVSISSSAFGRANGPLRTANLQSGGQITSGTSGTGNGGTITLGTGVLSLDGASTEIATTSSGGADSTGRGGRIAITLTPGNGIETGNVSLTHGAAVSSSSVSAGAAGSVTIQNAKIILVDGTKSAISTDAGPIGSEANVSPGSINLSSSSLTISNGGLVSASTAGFSKGGNITIATTGTLNLVHGGTIDASSFSSMAVAQADGAALATARLLNTDAPDPGFGNGGSIRIGGPLGTGLAAVPDATSPKTINILRDSTIQASSDNTDGGSINIFADNVNIQHHGSVQTKATNGNGGAILINAATLFYLNDYSFISTHAGLVGGNITIDPEFDTLNHSFIDAFGGKAEGNVFIRSSFSLKGDSGITASGTVTIESLPLDLSGSLVGLPADLTDEAKRLRESCARAVNHEFSSLVVVGRSGTETAPDELNSDSGSSDGGPGSASTAKPREKLR